MTNVSNCSVKLDSDISYCRLEFIYNNKIISYHYVNSIQGEVQKKLTYHGTSLIQDASKVVYYAVQLKAFKTADEFIKWVETVKYNPSEQQKKDLIEQYKAALSGNINEAFDRKLRNLDKKAKSWKASKIQDLQSNMSKAEAEALVKKEFEEFSENYIDLMIRDGVFLPGSSETVRTTVDNLMNKSFELAANNSSFNPSEVFRDLADLVRLEDIIKSYQKASKETNTTLRAEKLADLDQQYGGIVQSSTQNFVVTKAFIQKTATSKQNELILGTKAEGQNIWDGVFDIPPSFSDPQLQKELSDLLKNQKFLKEGDQGKTMGQLYKDLIRPKVVEIATKRLEALGTTDPKAAYDSFSELIEAMPNLKGQLGETYAKIMEFGKDGLVGKLGNIKYNHKIDITQHPNLNFSNKDYIEPDQLVISAGRQKQAKMVDVKTGYEEGNIDLDQLDNYLKLMNNPSFFKNDLEEASKISLEYLFLPGKKGGDAKKAAKNAKEKILDFIENNITEQKQKDLFMDNLEVKYVDKDGLLKIF